VSEPSYVRDAVVAGSLISMPLWLQALIPWLQLCALLVGFVIGYLTIRARLLEIRRLEKGE
jgi:hypothetical protein